MVRQSHEIGKTPPRRRFRTGLTGGGRVDQPGSGGVDAELLAAQPIVVADLQLITARRQVQAGKAIFARSDLLRLAVEADLLTRLQFEVHQRHRLRWRRRFFRFRRGRLRGLRRARLLRQGFLRR